MNPKFGHEQSSFSGMRAERMQFFSQAICQNFPWYFYVDFKKLFVLALHLSNRHCRVF
jgi:hypothetical protein